MQWLNEVYSCYWDKSCHYVKPLPYSCVDKILFVAGFLGSLNVFPRPKEIL